MKLGVSFAACAVLLMAGRTETVRAADPDFLGVSQEIDRRLAEHWQAEGITPAEPADDATLLRRLYVDLNGRIPTSQEWETRLKGDKPLADRYPQLVQELLEGPEFPLHLGSLLEEMLTSPAASNPEFADYLRRSIRQDKPWNEMFREMMVGPWNSPETKPATRFLALRAKDIDRLTTDTTRIFFGVDVSCARCHDHPLVDDWKQDHYYGMASFFNRTTGGGGSIGEKSEGDVNFKTIDGEQHTARVMFLSGQVIEDPPGENGKKAKVSRREQLVGVALDNKTFFSRAMVNHVWQMFYGQGLVHPVDQIHSGNPPSVPGLMEWLAEDFVQSNYDLRRLVGAVVTSRAYRLSSRWEQASPPPAEGAFAVTRLRLMSPRQYALSLLVATGRADFREPDALERRAEQLVGASGAKRTAQYLAAEQQMAPLVAQLDPGLDGQASAAEALFLSNNPDVQAVVKAEGETLAARMAALDDPAKMAELAIRALYTRPPAPGEVERLAAWLAEQDDKPQACEQLVWILATSAEFRFKH